MSHGIWKCSCGALIKQCRCIGPHPVHVIPNGCKACQDAIAKGFTPTAAAVLRPENV